MNQRKLYRWVKQESKGWEGLSRHFRANVVAFSRAVVKAQSSQVRKIAGCAGGCSDSQRRRLQRFVSQPKAMGEFFKAWTRTVSKAVRSKVWVLIVDETKLKNQLGLMMVGLAYEGRSIPLAWRVYRANSSAEYPAEGQARMIIRLLKVIRTGLPKSCRVCVLADRGIGTSPLLMRGIMALGWTFEFRVTRMSKIILEDGSEVTFYDQVTAPGQTYAASGLVFKQRGRIPAHVRVVWGQQAKQKWSLVTNDPSLTGWEYAKRMWIDESFRDLKSYGWHLESASLLDPLRIARLLILLVVAYVWMLIWGHHCELNHLTTSPHKRSNGSSVRHISLFREGRQAFLALPFSYCRPLSLFTGGKGWG